MSARPDPPEGAPPADLGHAILDPMDLRMGDVVRLRKTHPCGGTDWEIVRLGGDVGLRCLGCERRIILERPVLRRRMKAMVSRGDALDPAVERALYGDVSRDE
jgi:hypothetical protein